MLKEIWDEIRPVLPALIADAALFALLIGFLSGVHWLIEQAHLTDDWKDTFEQLHQYGVYICVLVGTAQTCLRVFILSAARLIHDRKSL